MLRASACTGAVLPFGKSGRARVDVMVRGTFFVAMAMLLSSENFSPRFSLARIETMSVDETGVAAILVGDSFGMAAGGIVNFDVELDAEEQEEPLANTYIVVVAASKTTSWYEFLVDNASLKVDDPPPLCVSPSSGRFEVTESSSFNLSIAEHDIYSAYLLLCQPEGTFIGEVTAGFVNLDPEGGLTQHLPIELTMLPGIYSVISFVYFGMVLAWTAELVRLRQFVLHVHYLCLVSVLIKAIETALVAGYFHRQNNNGENQEGLKLVAIVFENMSRVMFLLTLLLFSLGWGFVRPALRGKEAWLVAITIGLYGAISLVEAGCSGDTSNWCSGLALMEYAVRSLIMLSTVVAINFNITHIRFCIQLPWTSSSSLEYLKLSRYLSFRLTFLAYLLLPTVLLVIKITVLSWEYEWVYSALEEFVTMLIYAHLGTTFAPFDPWLLTRAFDHSLEQVDTVP